MNTQQKASSTIKINVPAGILHNAQSEARRIGISLQDFIRMLMATYFAHSPSIRAISRDQALWDRAQEEIKAGQYRAIKNKKELTTYLDSLTA
ncbi:hypothetical protein A2973_02745 [Candidatus Gottesmanbacteria bacterium RIFCSPLOWO2_01_FULL_49_10]|uniref:Uncharacterized protein n=1 Tax=Candidatus Gottesmanbacteria bacterium RIFCSPLOWO2_01_FULL_49_10 TaxID=1798396 RepID=A0A1F6AXQ7_9BACT|nr:MAG: hypothetical protein UY10_C0004G0038 [Microgenomates group bacterium GW2011_GWA2_47_8]OGG29282.1 MAG: hypothetical protein A2973_02745 [Candidatus Gottesmanbacteria bacterium RIFCSPLOWO2_01_FULL_49_10]